MVNFVGIRRLQVDEQVINQMAKTIQKIIDQKAGKANTTGIYSADVPVSKEAMAQARELATTVLRTDEQEK